MRVYTAEVQIASLLPTAGDAILVVEAPTDMVVQIIQAGLYNRSVDTAEQLHAEFNRVTATGSIASAQTPDVIQHDQGDAATSCTLYGANASGLATEPDAWDDGAFWPQGWNNLAGYEYEPTLDARPILSPGWLAGIRLMDLPSLAFDARAFITYAEIGGGGTIDTNESSSSSSSSSSSQSSSSSS